MDLDKKTSIRVSFYNHDTEEINSWPLEPSNIRLVLLMKTLTSEKEKLENENISEEKKKDIIDFVLWDVRRFLEIIPKIFAPTESVTNGSPNSCSSKSAS